MNSISKGFTYQNLTLHLIHGPDRVDGSRFMPLGEALKTGSVRVHETGEIGRLDVENLWDKGVEAAVLEAIVSAILKTGES